MKVVNVFSTYDDMEAELIKNLLENHNISCQVISDITHSVFPFTHDHKLSEVRIAVTEEEKTRAEELIKEFLDSSEFEFSTSESDDSEENDDGESSDANQL